MILRKQVYNVHLTDLMEGLIEGSVTFCFRPLLGIAVIKIVSTSHFSFYFDITSKCGDLQT